MFDILKDILMSEKELSKTNSERLKKTLVYMNSNLIYSDGNMYLTVESLIEINSIKNKNWVK